MGVLRRRTASIREDGVVSLRCQRQKTIKVLESES